MIQKDLLLPGTNYDPADKMNLNRVKNALLREYRRIENDRNGICKYCNNLTCKRDKKTVRKACNIFVEKDENKGYKK